MQGLLLVDKPDGWTSFDVVNYVRKMVAESEGKKPRQIKCGHTGTLDPAATGLLILCVGREYTKKVPQLINQDKTYKAELTLGKVSTTGDKEGEISQSSDKEPRLSAVLETVESFIGEIEQTPHAFSALKINGERAYNLARAGKEVKLDPRKVTVYTINNIEYKYPTITLDARVSSGTYIRSLAEDIGKKLGVGAYLSSLRRTSIGDKKVSQAYTVSELSRELLVKTLDTTD